jgi:Fe-S oxidoreductase
MGFNLQKCNFCGICLERCHYSKFTKEECAEEIRKLIKGEPARITDVCVTCSACNEYCPTGANPYDLILRRIEERGYEAAPAFRHITEGVDSEELSPTKVIWGEPDKPILHTCTFYEWIPHLYDRQLFKGTTLMIGGHFACRLYFEHLGRQSVFKEYLPKRVENVARVAGNREVVMMHDDCYSAFTTRAMDWGINVPFKVVHQSEYLRDYLKAHKAQIKKLNTKIAYHQPCASHYTPWQNEWIDEVMELIGCERVKRTYDRDNQICCGAVVASRQGLEVTKKIRKANIEDAKAAGAEAFVMQCPLCAVNLRDGTKAAGMEPYMLPQLCSLALGEKLPGPGAGLGDDRAWIQTPLKVVRGQITQISELKG